MSNTSGALFTLGGGREITFDHRHPRDIERVMRDVIHIDALVKIATVQQALQWWVPVRECRGEAL